MDRAEWLNWRHKGLGSSDVPAVHRASPYKTPLQLWEEKIQDTYVEKPSSFVMDIGNAVEPIMRAKFATLMSEKFGGMTIDFVPENLQMKELDFMKASLDGYFEVPMFGKIGIECKYMGASAIHTLKNSQHENPLKALRPDYWIQMQHQILVANLQHHFFIATSEKHAEKTSIEYWCKVDRDEDFLATHVKECFHFWNLVQKKRPPKPMEGDVVPLTKRGSMKLAKRYSNLITQIKDREIELSEVKQQLIAMCEHPKNSIHDLVINQTTRKGNVNYKEVPELQGVDLEKYRGKDSIYWTVKKTGDDKDEGQ